MHICIYRTRKKNGFLSKKEKKNGNKDQIYHLCFGVRFSFSNWMKYLVLIYFGLLFADFLWLYVRCMLLCKKRYNIYEIDISNYLQVYTIYLKWKKVRAMIYLFNFFSLYYVILYNLELINILHIQIYEKNK